MATTLRVPDGTQPQMNYQFGGYTPPGANAIAGAPTNTVSKEGSVAQTFNPAGLPPGAVGLPQLAVPNSQIPQQGETGGRVNPPPVAAVPPGGTGGAPTFTAPGAPGTGGDGQLMAPGAGGAYDRPAPETIGGKTPIVRQDAYDIGPYYGYAFDAGNRVLNTGYDAAGQLAAAGTQAAALGVGGGQQVAGVAQDYAGTIAQAGAGAQGAAQNYEDMIRRDRINTNDAAGQAATLGLAGQQAAQQAGAQMGAQGGQFINQGAQAAGQNIADVNLGLSENRARQSAQYANQLAGIGAQEGPSAAQAQLQSALNQSNAQNLAMARSGRGWGGSASAQTQALAANAAAGQQASNQSAILRSQEEQQRLQMLSQNVGNAAQLQTAGAQTALAQQQAQAQVSLQEAQQQAQQQQALYGLGLQSQQQGAQLGLQGSGLALQGNQQALAGYGQASQQAAQAAQTDLAGRQANIAALGQAGGLATQGLQAGTELGLQGIGQGAGIYAQGQQFAQGGELQAMQFASQQQQAMQALQNADLQQYGIQRGVAIQQQAATNQLIGAGIQTAGTLAAGAAMMSDKTTKTDVKPASVDLRPMSNYELLGGMAGDAGVTNAGVSAGAGAGGADLAQQAKTQKGLATMAGGVSDFGAAMGQPGGINPILAQSLQGVGAGQVMSDRSSKKDIEALDNVQRDNIMGIRNAKGMSPTSAFDAAQAYSYQYKQPEKYGEGEFVGLMAQDLAKSPAGSTAVVPQANGKLAVDMNRLGMLTAAAQSQTQEQLSTMEEKLARLQRRVLSQQANADGTY